MNKPVSTSKLRAGRSIINQNHNERIFKRGTLMFIEGESSAEMFIVRTGKIRILKQEGENTVELAVLGPGSVLGELSLLDNQPRSATAQVIEDTVVTVIDEELFKRTLQGVFPWLRDLISLVTRRLRDTMKRCTNDIVNTSISGVIRIILSLNESEGTLLSEDQQAVSLQRVKETIYSITGLGGNEAETVFLHLILKKMILIRKNAFGQEFVLIKEPDILSLYMAFLRARQCGRKLVGEDFGDKTIGLIESVLLSGDRVGNKEGEKLRSISFQELTKEFEQDGISLKADPGILDELVHSKLIMIKECASGSDSNHCRRDNVVIYNADTLKRICSMRKWLPVFQEEIRY